MRVSRMRVSRMRVMRCEHATLHGYSNFYSVGQVEILAIV